jgi:hypothetical protein
MDKLFMLQDSRQLPEVVVLWCKRLLLRKPRCPARYPQSPDYREIPGSQRIWLPLYGLPLVLIALTAILPLSANASITTSNGITTDPLNLAPPVRQAYEQFYILDYDGALARFEKIQADHPTDPIAVDYVLDCTLFKELYRLDLMDTTFYAHDGFLTGKHLASAADPAVAIKINSLIQKAIGLANDRLAANPEDTDAIFARGWARGLAAIYIGLVNRSFLSALHLALQARSDNEKVLAMSPNYVDAKLVVGVHNYIVGSLPFAFKVMAGLAGIKGSKTKGIQDLEDDGSRGVLSSVEARTALALFLRREAKYADAITVMQSLREQYPRDFLFCLEVANLTKDIGNGPEAVAEYRAILKKTQKTGYFPTAHPELAWFGLAEALRGQRSYLDAAYAYDQAAAQPTTNGELRGRCQLNAGEMYDILNQRDKAQQQYQAVLLNQPGSSQAESARKYLKSPFTLQ